MTELLRTIDPAVEPVTLADCSAHLQGYNSGDASLVTGLISVARELFEAHTGISLIEQEWQLSLPAFQNMVRLPKPPFRSVTSITYYDTAGELQTLAAATYRVSLAGILTEAYGQSYPGTESGNPAAVLINFKTGVYTASSASPPVVDTATGTGSPSNGNPDILTGKFTIAQHAILIMVAHLYENRTLVAPVALSECPMSYQAMVNSCRVEWV